MDDSLDKILDDGESSDSSAEEDAARDILAAVKANDAKALSLALTRHYEACEASKGEDNGEDDYEEG